MSDFGRHLIAERRTESEREAHMRECSIILALLGAGVSRGDAYRRAAKIVMGPLRQGDNGGPMLEDAM